jgi:predicted ATPase
MLTSLHIKHFRSLYDVSIELGRVNVFIGANGAGKSNVLEAVGVVSAALGRGLDDRTLGERGVRRSVPTLFKSSFKGKALPRSFTLAAELGAGVDYRLSVSASDTSGRLQFQTEELRVGKQRIFGRGPRGSVIYAPIAPMLELPAAEASRSLWDTHRALMLVPVEAAEALKALVQYGIFAPETGVMRGTTSEQFPGKPLGLAGSGLASAFPVAMRSGRRDRATTTVIDRLLVLSGWAERIHARVRDEAVTPQHVASADPRSELYFVDRFMNSKRNELSAYDASEGTLYLLFIAVLLAHPETPPIFALDNVDSTLNPAVVRRTIEHIAAAVCAKREGSPLPRQVFLTTHHPSALDGLDLFNDDQRVFVVWRDESAGGVTKITRIKPPRGMTRETWVVEKHGQRLSALLLDGQIPHALAASA